MLEHKTDKRLNFVPLTEVGRVSPQFPYVVKLREVPDIAANVSITGFTRVQLMPQAPTEFFVNRNGDVYFHESKKNTQVTINYFGGGSILAAADWNEMVDVIANSRALMQDMTNILFGNVWLKIAPQTVNSTIQQLNNATAGNFKLTFTISVVRSNNVAYTWLNDIPVYIAIDKQFVDADVAIPTIRTMINGSPAAVGAPLLLQGGTCQFQATYDTDYGTYKKYTTGDYVRYTVTTSDPGNPVGLNLTAIATHSIQ